MTIREPDFGRQLLLDLGRDPSFEADDYLISPANELAASRVRAWPDWPGRTLLLVGPPGSGKSHLAAIWTRETEAKTVTSDQPLDISLWAGGGRRVLLEDCDRAERDEADFFHALNLVRETDGWLLATARTHPEHWGLTTPDLLSRLRLATVATIERPDNELIKAVTVKLFADRQIRIEGDIVSYAARHCEQSLEAIARFVAAVDDAALASGRRITRAMAATTLARLDAADPTYD